jgi:hypothetical protein
MSSANGYTLLAKMLLEGCGSHSAHTTADEETSGPLAWSLRVGSTDRSHRNR